MSVDTTLWRTNPEHVSVNAWLHAPVTVFAASVNMATFTFPLQTLTFDTVTVGAYTDIEEFLLVLIGSTAGADDLGRALVVRDASGGIATATTISINRSPRGRRNGEIDPADNAFITVLDLRPIWSLAPYIDQNGTTFKWGRIPFANHASMPPVANAGPDALKIVATSGDTATLDFDGALASFATHPSASGSLLYAWDFGDATPSTSTSAAPTGVVFPYGVRYVKLTVTDSLGTASSAWALIAVVTKADCLQKFSFSQPLKQTAEGQTVVLQIEDSIPMGTYPNGTELLMNIQENHNGTVESLIGASDREDMLFAGWHQTDPSHTGQGTALGFIGTSTLQFADAAQIMATLPGFPETLNRASTPTRWEERPGLNIDRYVHSILQWGGNGLTRCDFAWSATGETYAFPTLGSDGKSLYAQADERTQAIRYKLTCNANDQLRMLGDPQVQPTLAQSIKYGLPTTRTTDIQVDINETDWNKYEFAYLFAPRVHWNWGQAVLASPRDVADVTDIGTVFCTAPGAAPGQGLTEQTSGEQITVNQYELNACESNRYNARMNNFLGNLSLTLTRMTRAIQCADMTWVTLTVSAATAAPRGITFASALFLPIEIDYSYDVQNGLCQAVLTLEHETDGQFSDTYVPPAESTNPLPAGSTITYPPSPTLLPSVLGRGTATLALFDTAGGIWITHDGLTPAASGGPTWIYYSMAWDGTLLNFVVDAYSPLYLGTGNTVNGWLATTTKLYRITDIFGVTGSPRALTVRHTFNRTLPSSSLTRLLDASFCVQNFVVSSSYYSNDTTWPGVWVTRTSDDITYTEVQVGPGGYNTDGSNIQTAGLYVSDKTPGLAYCQAITTTGSGTGAVGKLFKSTDYGVTWGSENAAPTTSLQGLEGPLFVPYDGSESTVYWTNLGTFPHADLYRVNGTSQALLLANTDIYAVRGLAIHPLNADRAILCGDVSAGTTGVNVTTNLSASPPTFALVSSDGYMHVYTAGDDQLTFYLLGNDLFALTSDFGMTIDSKLGNISGAGEFVGLCGG